MKNAYSYLAALLGFALSLTLNANAGASVSFSTDTVTFSYQIDPVQLYDTQGNPVNGNELFADLNTSSGTVTFESVGYNPNYDLQPDGSYKQSKTFGNISIGFSGIVTPPQALASDSGTQLSFSTPSVVATEYVDAYVYDAGDYLGKGAIVADTATTTTDTTPSSLVSVAYGDIGGNFIQDGEATGSYYEYTDYYTGATDFQAYAEVPIEWFPLATATGNPSFSLGSLAVSVPEPASLSLLPVAGMMFMRRRRA